MKVDKTLRHHGRAAVRALRGVWWDLVRPPAIRPVIVIGCSRAGTTLVYKTFSESRELGTLQRETHDFWMELHHPRERGWDTHALDARHASASDRDFVTRYFYAWTGRSRWVDKNNQNGLCVPYLAALFPDAHFLFVKRSPGDNLHSLIEGWGKPEEFATWSAALPEAVAIDGGRYTRWCFFLAEGWRAYTRATIEEVCAFQYVAINSAILEAKAAVPGAQWSEVFYEDLVRDPVGEFRRLFTEADLSFTPALEDHCANVLATPYNAFSEIRLDKWKDGRNRQRIERVMDRVEPVARRMGYAL
ncbi:MAG: sulfotransferase [Burkholderiales bacterium]|nr:sulfotransferase [Burkholderiales bacterium]